MISLLITALSLTSLAEANIQGKVCVDNSYYGEVEYVEDDLSCCSIGIADSVCTTAIQEACAEVTETVCDVILTTECTPVDCPVTLVSVNNVPMTFTSKKCETKDVEIPHTKVRQVPRNITKKLCNTIWQTNPDGEKVWAGEDENECEEIVWVGFEEEEYESILKTTETECVDDTDIPYSTCQQTEFLATRCVWSVRLWLSHRVRPW